MSFNAPKGDVKGNPQQAAVTQELRFLRAQVEALKQRQTFAANEAADKAPVTKGPIVEAKVDATKLDLKSKTALRNLLVAVENYFGPVAGSPTPKMGGELTAAVKEAEAIVRPNRVEKKTP